MTMGVKYQMLCSTQSSDMLQVTMQHFDVLDEIVKGSDVQTLLDNARALCIEVLHFLSCRLQGIIVNGPM